MMAELKVKLKYNIINAVKTAFIYFNNNKPKKILIMENTSKNNDNHKAPNESPISDSADMQSDREDGHDTEKYLELEQPGVSYTQEHDFTTSDNNPSGDGNDKWKSTGDNSRNSDAFNQDDYILNDNIDLDEDQNDSISSEDSER